jgi:hypothetical protein
MRRMHGSCASDQLLDRLELEDEQPVADERQASHLPAGLTHVVGLGDEVYRISGDIIIHIMIMS